MRDTDLYSLAFDMHLGQLKAVAANHAAYASSANILALNTFDELSRNRLFLLGLDLERSSTGGFRFRVFTKSKSKRSHIVNAGMSVWAVNLTFTSHSVEVLLNQRPLVRIASKNNTNLISRSLLKAHGSFMLNMTHVQQETKSEFKAPDDLVASCLSNFKVQTRKQMKGEVIEWSTYELMQLTKSIYVANDNDVLNRECRVKVSFLVEDS